MSEDKYLTWELLDVGNSIYKDKLYAEIQAEIKKCILIPSPPLNTLLLFSIYKIKQIYAYNTTGWVKKVFLVVSGAKLYFFVEFFLYKTGTENCEFSYLNFVNFLYVIQYLTYFRTL